MGERIPKEAGTTGFPLVISPTPKRTLGEVGNSAGGRKLVEKPEEFKVFIGDDVSHLGGNVLTKERGKG